MNLKHRLAFHDCAPYTDKTGGCDGCLNLDENLHENNGLQYPVAVLEKLYLEKDYPPNAPTLDVSLKDSGVSRADLWAFAALMSLDEVWQSTRGKCLPKNVAATCGEFECYVQPPKKVLELFKTGREDCTPKNGASKFQSYLTEKLEAHPDMNGNGPMTFDYFEKKFNMGKRASLALLGRYTFLKSLENKQSLFSYRCPHCRAIQ